LEGSSERFVFENGGYRYVLDILGGETAVGLALEELEPESVDLRALPDDPVRVKRPRP
jgi:hypothetical protein